MGISSVAAVASLVVATKAAKELGALAVSRLKEPGAYPVGKVAGLYLQVSSETARSWILRVKVGEKRRERPRS
jgi:hypothetical protein